MSECRTACFTSTHMSTAPTAPSIKFIISKRMRPTLLKRSVKPERRSGASPAEVATQGGVKECPLSLGHRTGLSWAIHIITCPSVPSQMTSLNVKEDDFI